MWRETHHSDGLLATRSPDAAIAALADRQHGVVSMAQLRGLGLRRGAIERRIANGRLHPVHRGVYAVGHRALAERGRSWAAILACGGPDRAALSHRSAAALWDLAPSPSVIEVTTLHASRTTKRLRVHRATNARVTTKDGLPVTTVAQTLLDLAATLPEHRLRRLCHRAELLRLLDANQLESLLAEQFRSRGTARLRRALDELALHEPDITRSELEERFLKLVARAGLPRPRVNTNAAGLEVDFLWPAHRLVAETDGAAAHLTPTAFEHDRERDVALALAGFRVVRFTWRQVDTQPGRVAAALRELLSDAR